MAPCAQDNEQGCCAGACQSSSSSDERALTQWGLMRSTEWKRITWFAEQRLQYVRNTRAIPVLKLNYDSYRVCFTGMNITAQSRGWGWLQTGAAVSCRISHRLSFVKSGLPSVLVPISVGACSSESPWGSQIRGPHERLQRADLAHEPRVERRREVQK